MADKLWLVLYDSRTYPTVDRLGAPYDMGGSKAHENHELFVGGQMRPPKASMIGVRKQPSVEADREVHARQLQRVSGAHLEGAPS